MVYYFTVARIRQIWKKIIYFRKKIKIYLFS